MACRDDITKIDRVVFAKSDSLQKITMIFIKNQWFSLNPDASKCRSSTYNCMKTFDFQCKSLKFSQKISFSQNYSAIFYYNIIIPTGHTDIINHNPPTFANVTVYVAHHYGPPLRASPRSNHLPSAVLELLRQNYKI